MVTQSVVLFVWIKQSTHAVFSLIFNLFRKSQTAPPKPTSVFHDLCWTNLTVCCVYILTQQKLISNCPLYTNINCNLNTLSQKTHDVSLTDNVETLAKRGSITAWGWKVHVSSHLKIYIMNELSNYSVTHWQKKLCKKVVSSAAPEACFLTSALELHLTMNQPFLSSHRTSY